MEVLLSLILKKLICFDFSLLPDGFSSSTPGVPFCIVLFISLLIIAWAFHRVFPTQILVKNIHNLF